MYVMTIEMDSLEAVGEIEKAVAGVGRITSIMNRGPEEAAQDSVVVENVGHSLRDPFKEMLEEIASDAVASRLERETSGIPSRGVGRRLYDTLVKNGVVVLNDHRSFAKSQGKTSSAVDAAMRRMAEKGLARKVGPGVYEYTGNK